MIWRRNNGPCKRIFRWFSIIWTVQRLISSLSVLKRRNIRLKGAIHSQLKWAILLCDVIPDGKKLSKLRSFDRQSRRPQLSFTVVFQTKNCAVHSGNPTVSSVYLPTTRWHHLKAHPFLAIHSADGHHMIYSTSNTTSYSTFYAFFYSFRITLWPAWVANSQRQPYFHPP
jgi:hypothetical protein